MVTLAIVCALAVHCASASYTGVGFTPLEVPEAFTCDECQFVVGELATIAGNATSLAALKVRVWSCLV